MQAMCAGIRAFFALIIKESGGQSFSRKHERASSSDGVWRQWHEEEEEEEEEEAPQAIFKSAESSSSSSCPSFFPFFYVRTFPYKASSANLVFAAYKKAKTVFGHQTSEVFFFRPTILLPFFYAQFAHMMCKTSPTCKKTAVLYSSAVLRRSLPSYSDNIRFVGRVVDLGRWIRPKILLYPRYSFTLCRRKRGGNRILFFCP